MTDHTPHFYRTLPRFPVPLARPRPGETYEEQQMRLAGAFDGDADEPEADEAEPEEGADE